MKFPFTLHERNDAEKQKITVCDNEVILRKEILHVLFPFLTWNKNESSFS